MALFGVFLDAPFARLIMDTLIFLEAKGAKVVHMSYKFHLHLTCSSWVFSLQMFSYLQKAGVKPPPSPFSFPLEE